MKLSVLTVPLSDMTLKDTLAFLKNKGVQAFELPSGGFPGKAHCNPEEILKDEKAFQELKETIDNSGLELAAMSVHGNAIHPNPEIAKQFHDDFVNCVLLAEKLGCKRIITFSGCPGGSPEDKTPNWVTCPWPDDFLAILDYQWNEVLIPYWKKMGAWAQEHGIEKIAFEMHPGFCVYNPETMLKIRKAVGPILGANFDPSHLFWQGIDPVAALRELGDAVYFFHAKDTRIDAYNTARNGVLDTKHYSDALNRSWVFRTIGYGHDADVWKDIVSTLRKIGYDDVMSIEHEDGLMSSNEGLSKAIEFLKDVMVFEDPGEMYWA